MRARILMAALLLGVAGGLSRADEKAPQPLERAELDKRIVNAVYDSAYLGTDIFNKGGYAECARLYHGTLIAVVPMLDHRPKLQSDAKARIERSKGMKASDAAFELRTALDEIQNAIAPPNKKEMKDAKEPKVMKTTLWERLGGEMGVKSLVRTAWMVAVEDPKAAAFRDKKIDSAKLEQVLLSFVSSSSDGPLPKYNGADLKAAIGGAPVTDADFDTLTAIMVAKLKTSGATDADIATLGKAWEGTRKDFVTKK